MARRSLSGIPVCDGLGLHQRVPPSHWCVTQRDIADFRRAVQRSVRRGTVAPTASDDFDPGDDTIGPKIFTVNGQLIKPVTARAGNPSWALMLHPEGLECDLFITHCWTEGIYEFIDKVLHSWPRSSRNAYCCMLSNPQNLDIGGLISNPNSSPFALALLSARCMLVVPNRACSIYTRIWCVYEASLSYEHNKLIFTATPPIRGLPSRLLALAIGFATFFGLTSAAFHSGLVRPSPHMNCPVLLTISVVACASLLLRLPARRSALDSPSNMCGPFDPLQHVAQSAFQDYRSASSPCGPNVAPESGARVGSPLWSVAGPFWAKFDRLRACLLCRFQGRSRRFSCSTPSSRQCVSRPSLGDRAGRSLVEVRRCRREAWATSRGPMLCLSVSRAMSARWPSCRANLGADVGGRALGFGLGRIPHISGRGPSLRSVPGALVADSGRGPHEFGRTCGPNSAEFGPFRPFSGRMAWV